ncbi:hypothetical protein L1887_32473 [Cichorium endivia]|nr:hypothetical protein L1887_32473 [Cichorium endivia]
MPKTWWLHGKKVVHEECDIMVGSGVSKVRGGGVTESTASEVGGEVIGRRSASGPGEGVSCDVGTGGGAGGLGGSRISGGLSTAGLGWGFTRLAEESKNSEI